MILPSIVEGILSMERQEVVVKPWKVQCFSAFPIGKQNHHVGRSKIKSAKARSQTVKKFTYKQPLILRHLSL